MSKSTTPLIHIGYHKAGSSWLQTSLFAMPRDATRARDPRSCVPRSFVNPWTRQEITKTLVAPDPFRFDPHSAQQFFRPAFDACTDVAVVPVVSHERLSGLPQLGGLDAREIADRLARVFPAARILIVIREQSSAIVSTWKGYVQRGGARTVGDYVTQLMEPGTLPPRAGHFEYDRLISYYRFLFGKENVCVLPFELLMRDPIRFVTEIAVFAGAETPTSVPSSPVNPSLSGLGASVKRMLNLTVIPIDIDLMPSSRLNTQVLRAVKQLDSAFLRRLSGPSDNRIASAVSRIIGYRYGASNRLTAELTGMDLAAYGYRC